MTAKKKSPASKSSPKPTPKTARKPAPKATTKASASTHDELTKNTLKFVDEAAALLRKGITTGADAGEKSRVAANKKAHSLLGKASSSLSDLLGGGASLLRKVSEKL